MDTLLGITFKDWWTLLRENRFAVDRAYVGQAAKLTFLSLLNSMHRRRESKMYDAAIQDVSVRAPIFILGHWRSGTTLLHNLMELDEQFAYPNLFQVSNPHTFLFRETLWGDQLGVRPAEKRPMDNMQVTAHSPGEDEFAIAILSLRSPVVAWSFPRHEDRYDSYLTFCDASEKDLARWRVAFSWFLKKLTWKYKLPLLLKSPAHTGRIRLLLELYPDARFIHIHRDPFTVFQSTQRLYTKAVPRSYLHNPDAEQIDAGIMRRYALMYDAFFEEKDLIPAGQFHELSFEDLERDMVGEVSNIYQALGLDGFPALEQKLREYVSSIAGYQKNQHPPLAESLSRQVSKMWRRSFEEWGYAL